MRTTHGYVASALLGLAIASGHLTFAQSGDAKADAVIASARKALGGEQKLAALKSLSIRGSYRREAAMPPPGGGGNMVITMTGPGGGEAPQMTGDLEIDIVLPDKYIKVDAGTGMMAMTRTEGFEGERPFIDVSSSQPGVRIITSRPTDDPSASQNALRRTREDLARLMLGLVAGVQPAFTVTYSYAGQAESPDGKADVVEVKGPDNFAARLFIDAESHQPLMLTYMAAEPRMVMRTVRGDGPPGSTGTRVAPQGRAGGTLSAEDKTRLDDAMKDAAAAPATLVEQRLFFSDFRPVDGLTLPFHIARGNGTKTTEEWDIKSYKANPSIKPERFKVGS